MRRYSDAWRRDLSEQAKARWAAKPAGEKLRHAALSLAAYRLKYPAMATWPERWVADVIQGA